MTQSKNKSPSKDFLKRHLKIIYIPLSKRFKGDAPPLLKDNRENNKDLRVTNMVMMIICISHDTQMYHQMP